MAEKTAVDTNKPIGMATMLEDGTILLDLRAEGPAGESGVAQVRYPRTHPQYQSVLDHLGGLRPGEQKLVAPWP